MVARLVSLPRSRPGILTAHSWVHLTNLATCAQQKCWTGAHESYVIIISLNHIQSNRYIHLLHFIILIRIHSHMVLHRMGHDFASGKWCHVQSWIQLQGRGVPPLSAIVSYVMTSNDMLVAQCDVAWCMVYYGNEIQFPSLKLTWPLQLSSYYITRLIRLAVAASMLQDCYWVTPQGCP